MNLGSLKKKNWYRESRFFYRAATVYRQPLRYIHYRFFTKSKIRSWFQRVTVPKLDESYSIHFLCSHRDLDMLLWSLAGWYLVVPKSGQVFIHEDGSFTDQDRTMIKKLLPHARLIDYGWAKERFAKWLKNHPMTRKFREHDERYIFSIKLIDPYFVSSAPKRLILDTDLIWFRKPDELLQSLREGKTCFMKAGVKMFYKFADGQELSEDIAWMNSGVIAYQVQDFSLNALEEFCRRNGEDNPSRVIEQAGYAYVLSSGLPYSYLPQEKYHIKGPITDPVVVKHYTGPKRELYWLQGVPEIRMKIRRL